VKPRLFVPALITGPMLWAAFFPLDLGPIAFVALVPWLLLVRCPRARMRLYFAGYLGGVAFFLPALQWIRVAHPMMYLSWIGLALVCPLFWLFALFLLRRIDRLKAPLSLSVPVVWVALEYVRAHFPTGFPFLQHVGLYQMIGFGWYFLGYTQHEFLPLIQVADLGGVYAVSFLVAMINGTIAEWVVRSNRVRSWLRWGEVKSTPSRFLVPSTAGAAILLAASIAYGVVRLDHGAFEAGPHVAALQGSIPQDEKMARGQSVWEEYARLHVAALRLKPAPDLILWPETCMPIDWAEVVGAGGSPPTKEFREDMDLAEHYFGKLDLRLKHPHWKTPKPHWQAATLFGLNGLVWEDGQQWKYNSALLVGPNSEYLGRYDKMHLVIFGEYVPFKETLPWLQVFTPYQGDYSCRPGEHWTRFPLNARDGKEYTFACLICYEDSDPYIARQYVASEPVNFLVNISNDGWFNGTEEHEEHLAICRFRAIEARRSVVRAVNMGISCVIDPDGRVIALPGESWSASKKVEGIVAAGVPIDHRESWYAKFGDWLPATCWSLLVVGHLLSRVSRFRR
jgi:apolipoprotein N-acyltransferase